MGITCLRHSPIRSEKMVSRKDRLPSRFRACVSQPPSQKSRFLQPPYSSRLLAFLLPSDRLCQLVPAFRGTVVSFVVEDKDALESHQIGHDPLNHLPFSF